MEEIKKCEVCLSKAITTRNKIVLCKSCDSLFNKASEKNEEIRSEATKELDRRARRTEMILKKSGFSDDYIYNQRILNELKK